MNETEQTVLKAVEKYVYDRFGSLTSSNVVDFNEDELDRITTTDGYLDFTVENLEIGKCETFEDYTTYYVNATIYFQTDKEPIEGTTDTYECYRYRDGNEWIVDWHSS